MQSLLRYAIRESNSVVKIFKNFKEKKSFKPDFGAEGKYLLLQQVCWRIFCTMWISSTFIFLQASTVASCWVSDLLMVWLSMIGKTQN